MKKDQKLGELRAYACGIKGMEGSQIMNARSRGKAKSSFLCSLDMDIPYTSIRCKDAGAPLTSERFMENARYRNIPFAYVGMRVEVDGKPGVITGHNSSANLNVLFDDGQQSNCHPNWMVKYFDNAGRFVAEFKKGRTA